MKGLRRAAETKRFQLSGPALACAVACAAMLLAPASARANTITVNSTSDAAANDGVCTLREAITAANTNTASGAAAGECAAGAAGLDTIVFAIPGAGVKSITPASALPSISEAVFINGYSQPGSSANTNPLNAGINAVLLIEVSEGPIAGSLTINASGTTIRGLVLNGGSLVDKITVNASNVTIAGNFIGTNPAGTVAVPGSSGGFAIRQLQGSNNVIGGAAPADRNLLSGDLQGEIIVENGDNTQILGNYIGTDVTGTLALNVGSSQIGVRIVGGVPFVTTNTTISGNLISGNNGGAVFITSPGGGFVQGNLIGTQRDGVSPLGNGNFGGIDLGSTGFVVGGTSLGQANVIAFNTGWGVAVALNVAGNSILGNSIHSNSQLGISLLNVSPVPLANDACDVDTIPGNHGQNYPVITSAPVAAGNVTISGTLNSTSSTAFRIEFFSNVTADPSGNGEGQTFIGFTNVTTPAGACDVSFGPLVFPVPPGQTVFTATATDPANNTSEFSAAFPVGAPPTPTPTPTATPTPTPTATPTSTPVGPTPPPSGAVAVPALAPGVLAVFGLALAIAGFLLLRRNS